jgi:hypothetical protein
VINYVPFEIFGGPIIDEEQVAYLEGMCALYMSNEPPYSHMFCV